MSLVCRSVKLAASTALFSVTSVLPTYLCHYECVPQRKFLEQERKNLNSKDGTFQSIDYQLLNSWNNANAVDAVNAINRLPEHYRKILYLQGMRVIVASSDKDLPENFKKIHDGALQAYTKANKETDRLCGIAISDKTLGRMNTSAITFLHCTSPDFYSLHEMAHAFDAAAAYLLVGKDNVTELPVFQELYCRQEKAADPNADCKKMMPNGSPHYKEVFADGFAKFYHSSEKKQELISENPQLYSFLGELEQATLAKLIEIKQ